MRKTEISWKCNDRKDGVDKNLTQQEQRTQERKRKEEERKIKNDELMQGSGTNYRFELIYKLNPVFIIHSIA